MISLPNIEVTYQWSRRRRTIGLTVTVEGKLVVAAPWGTPKARLEQVVARHWAWIEKKAAARKAAWAPLKEGVAFFLGRPYRLTVHQGKAEAVRLGEAEIRLGLPAAGALQIGRASCRERV